MDITFDHASKLGEVALKLENITKRYGRIEVLHELNIEVRRGEFLVLLGPSGCGKTTLLRIVAGLIIADTGRVILEGKDITHLPPEKRDIGLVFQNYALFPHMSVRKNIAFGLRMRHMAKNQIAERVASVLEMLQLEALADRGVKQISGGQQQRVATARALALHPSILLLDEPLSNLDAKLRASLRVDITQLQRRLGITAIHVTHDQVEAMTMADRVILLKSGLIQQVGSPIDLYHRPSNLFVASFLGTPSINLFKVEVLEDVALIQECDSRIGKIVLSKSLCPDMRIQEIPQGEYILGVRPEDIVIQTGTPPSESTLCGEIIFLEALGSDIHLHVKLGEKVIVGRVPGALSGLEVGQRVGIEFRIGAGHLFDIHSERRLGDRTI